MNGRIGDRHKKVICIKCFKEFRSNYVNKHMLVHLRQEEVTSEKAPKRLCKENTTLQCGEESVDYVVKDVLRLLLDAVHHEITPAATIAQSDIIGMTSDIGEIETELMG